MDLFGTTIKNLLMADWGYADEPSTERYIQAHFANLKRAVYRSGQAPNGLDALWLLFDGVGLLPFVRH